VRLRANPHYWDWVRALRLRGVEFRNDLSREQGTGLVCDTAGEVDIVTELTPWEAERARRSRHARLVAVDVG